MVKMSGMDPMQFPKLHFRFIPRLLQKAIKHFVGLVYFMSRR